MLLSAWFQARGGHRTPTYWIVIRSWNAHSNIVLKVSLLHYMSCLTGTFSFLIRMMILSFFHVLLLDTLVQCFLSPPAKYDNGPLSKKWDLMHPGPSRDVVVILDSIPAGRRIVPDGETEVKTVFPVHSALYICMYSSELFSLHLECHPSHKIYYREGMPIYEEFSLSFCI